jgi:hypothetical protein
MYTPGAPIVGVGTMIAPLTEVIPFGGTTPLIEISLRTGLLRRVLTSTSPDLRIHR